jgi:hypothetical protein
MRILFDECVPRPPRKELLGHEVLTTRQMNWTGIENGDLLRLAETSFDVFLTVDRNIQHQQNLSGYDIAVIVLRARSKKLEALQPLIPPVLQRLGTIEAGEVVLIEL